MINFLVQAQQGSTYESMLEETIPVLQKYRLIDQGYKSDPELYGEERLLDVMASIDRHAIDVALIFDAECIENDEDYANIAKDMFEFSGVRHKLKKIKSAYDYDKEKAGLAILIEDVKEKRIWSQSSDWVAHDFIDFMSELFNKYFNKMIVTLPAVDQCMRIIVVDAGDHAALLEFFKLATRGFDSRQVYVARMVSTWFVCGVGFILCTLLGWYFFGFWWSLLISAIGWGVTTIVLVLKYAWVCAQEEDADELRRADPESYGRAIMNAFVEEAARREGDSVMGKRLKKVVELNNANT